MKSLKLLTAALVLVVSVVAFSSCQDEELAKGLSLNSIVANVSIGPIEQSKQAKPSSVGPNEMELVQTIVMDEDSLLLHEFVCDNLSSPFEEMTGTRSASTKTNTLKANGFGIQAFVDNPSDISSADKANAGPLTDGNHYIVNGKLAYSSSQWNFVDDLGTAVDYKWMDKIYFTFWSYYPKAALEGSTFGTQSDRHKMTISDYVVSSSSASQADLVVAYNNQYGDQTKYGTDGAKLSIGFKHILSEIYFDFTDVTTKGYTVDKIEIIGAYSKGSCTITGSSASTTTPKTSPDAISWASLSQPSTFTMSLNTATTDTLFMIPQELPSAATIRITMTKDGKTRTSEKTLTTTWEPGKYYKYQLTYTPPTDFKFSLKTASDATTTFTDKNTTSSVTKNIAITSTKKKSGSTKECEWDILSYKIGSGTEVPVEISETSITVEDLVLTEDLNNKRLKVESKRWNGIDKGGHDYWTNADGMSDTRWVPADWSTTYTEANPLDLSKFDYQSETPTSMNTANCYIVRHAGTYKIPLVYGNGVKGGSDNTGAYKGFSGTNSLATFQNHNGNNISSPFIENNTSCTANSAAIVWQDRQEDGKSAVIKDVQLVGSTATTYTADNVRYIQFTVSPDDIRQTNAVIAVKDNTASKNIMWSWHIWVTNDPAIMSGPIAVTNYTNYTYNFFPSSSLGWIDPKTYEDREDVTVKLVQRASGETITVTVKQTKPDKIASSGVVYQWGRKDPFPTGNVTPTKNTGTATLATAIKNPLTFYSSGTANNWFSTAYTNLWAGKFSNYYGNATDKSNSLTSKTIYDPSPVGYKVPSIFAYSGFSTTGSDPGSSAATTASPTGYNVPSGTKFDMGWNFNATSGTIFFDASGWSTDGTIQSKGVEGNYHSALLYSSADNHVVYWAWGLDGSNLYMKLTNTTGTRLGASVRPVTE